MPTWTSTANASMAARIRATAQPRAGSVASPVQARTTHVAPTTPAMPTPAVKNSKISRARPISSSRYVTAGLFTVWNSWSTRSSLENRTVAVVSRRTVPSSSTRSSVVSSATPSCSYPSRASIIDLIVGSPSSEIRCSKTSSRLASLRPSDPLRSTIGSRSEVDPYTVGAQWHTGVTDSRPRRHPRDVGHGEQLGRSAVQAGAGRPHPHGDRERRRLDALEQRLHVVAADHGAARVDLQDQRLRAVIDRPLDGLVDRPDDDRVEEPADLQHIDRPQLLLLLGDGRRVAGRRRPDRRQPRR